MPRSVRFSVPTAIRFLFGVVLLSSLSVRQAGATAIFLAESGLDVDVIGYFLNDVLLPDVPAGLTFSGASGDAAVSGFARGNASAVAMAALNLYAPEMSLYAAVAGLADGAGSRALANARASGRYRITNSSANTYEIGFDFPFLVSTLATGSAPNDFSYASALVRLWIFGGTFDVNTFRLSLGPGQSAVMKAEARAVGDAFVVPEPVTSGLVSAGLALLGIVCLLKRRRAVPGA